MRGGRDDSRRYVSPNEREPVRLFSLTAAGPISITRRVVIVVVFERVERERKKERKNGAHHHYAHIRDVTH